MKALTPKQEAFCRKFVECGSAVDAYMHVYAIKSREFGRRRAYELQQLEHVAAFIETLRAEAAKRHGATVDTIADQLDEDRAFARAAGNPSAAVSATMGKAKLYGLLTEKHDHNVTIRADDARQIVASLFAKHASKLGKA